MQDYYEILGVPRDASADEIRRAYRQLARRYHPDISGDDQAGAFREATEAYEVLRDASRRTTYDTETSRPPARPDRSEWLGDEIAVDFPSVDALLDRMRASFFGAGFGACLSAELILSPREAFFGGIVPIELPIRSICPSCGGRGECWLDPCERCGGTGATVVAHRVRLTVPPGVRDGARLWISVMPPAAPATTVEVRFAVT